MTVTTTLQALCGKVHFGLQWELVLALELLLPLWLQEIHSKGSEICKFSAV